MDIYQVKLIASAVRNAIETCTASELPWTSFPRGACGDASLVLGQVLDNAGIKGFEYVCGNRYNASGEWYSSHAWLENGNWIVDITADQFADVHDPVIVSNDSEWHRQWVQDRPTAGTLNAYGPAVQQLWRLLSILQPKLKF